MDMPVYDDAPLPDAPLPDGLDDDIEQCAPLGSLHSCSPAPVQDRSGQGAGSIAPA